MPVTLVGAASPEPPSPPALLVVRTFDDVRGVLAVLAGGREVLVVRRATDPDWRRTVDVLSGWAVGSAGELQRLSPNTLAAVPPGAPHRRAARGTVAALDEAFGPSSRRVSRDEERRLRVAAVAGDLESRARLVDVFAEIAGLVALWLCPPRLTQGDAARVAQQALDTAIAADLDRPLLAVLFTTLIDRLAG